ncbi:MAG: hypothetical protein M1837_002727 [Sclerophora amabilis]|nr:MAG: hypothetical protein M1837_002727 [Sclerophora amabilis]
MAKSPIDLTGNSELKREFIDRFDDEIFGSAYSSSIYISRILSLPPPRNKTFILGESGIEAELASEGVPYCGGTDPSLRRDMTAADFTAIASGAALDPDVGVVLAGLDLHVNYLKLSLAYHYLRRGALFLATNTDSTFPSSGALFPGAGTISVTLVNMLGGLPSGGGGGGSGSGSGSGEGEAKTEEAEGEGQATRPTVMGKPHQAMMDAIEGKFQLDRARTCMVGDRLDTDIKFGIEGGLGGTLLVGTGVSAKGDWEKVGGGGGAGGDNTVPMAFVEQLGDLREVMNK